MSKFHQNENFIYLDALRSIQPARPTVIGIKNWKEGLSLFIHLERSDVQANQARLTYLLTKLTHDVDVQINTDGLARIYIPNEFLSHGNVELKLIQTGGRVIEQFNLKFQ